MEAVPEPRNRVDADTCHWTVVSPRRSTGGRRRYSRHEIGRVQEVVSMMGEGMTPPAIRRILGLQHEVAELTRERDELARRLAGGPGSAT
ncbi:MerR family transcriptional regulator [Actinomadura coerulea]|uniref:MerR family transcriptional regulator n=1 Tax=Actinomadura coerulea TaxID=46159 RepID=UPI00343CA202